MLLLRLKFLFVHVKTCFRANRFSVYSALLLVCWRNMDCDCLTLVRILQFLTAGKHFFSTKMIKVTCLIWPSNCEPPKLMVFLTALFFQHYTLLHFLAMSAQWSCCWNITHRWMLWMSWNTLHFSEPVRWDTKRWYKHSLKVSC